MLGKSEHTRQRKEFLHFLQNNHNVKSKSSQYSTVSSQNLYRGNLDEEESIKLVFDKIVAKLEHEIPKESNRISSVIKDYLHQNG